jgi:hypothetical protein
MERGGAVLFGTLFVAWGYFHGNIALSYFSAVLSGAMSLLINVLLLVELVGLGTWWREGRASWLGEAGFLCAFGRALLGVAHGIYGIISATGIVDTAPWYVYVRTLTGLPPKVFGRLPGVPIGLATVGVASIRAKALEGWAPLPLATGLFGWAYELTDSGVVVETGFAHSLVGVLYGLGWVGWAAYPGPKVPKHAPTDHEGKANFGDTFSLTARPLSRQ